MEIRERILACHMFWRNEIAFDRNKDQSSTNLMSLY